MQELSVGVLSCTGAWCESHPSPSPGCWEHSKALGLVQCWVPALWHKQRDSREPWEWILYRIHTISNLPQRRGSPAFQGILVFSFIRWWQNHGVIRNMGVEEWDTTLFLLWILHMKWLFVPLPLPLAGPRIAEPDVCALAGHIHCSCICSAVTTASKQWEVTWTGKSLLSQQKYSWLQPAEI